MGKTYYLGLDIGGTKVEGAIAELGALSRSIEVFARKRKPMNVNGSVRLFIDLLADLIHDLLSEAKISLDDIRAIGLGLPGSLDPKTKIMMNGNTQFLIGHDIINLLKNKLQTDLPIVAQNDANLFVLAEAWGGVGRDRLFDEQVAIGITLGTGVGGGLISLGEIYNGAHGSGLEVGHVSLNMEGPSCYCGQKGCSESYLSGTALNKLCPAKEIFEKAKFGDVEASKILSDYRLKLVHLLSILNNLFNPHYFVFGGGLSSQEMIFEGLKSELEKHTFLSKEFCPEIYINKLGDSAGLFGAMIYAFDLLDA